MIMNVAMSRGLRDSMGTRMKGIEVLRGTFFVSYIMIKLSLGWYKETLMKL